MEQVAEIDADGLGAAEFHQRIVAACRPVVLRGLVRSWPAAATGRAGPAAILDGLAARAVDQPVETFYGRDDSLRPFFYADEHCADLNFDRRAVRLRDALADIRTAAEVGRGQVYVGSIGLRRFLPGFAEANTLDLPPPTADARIWIGTRSTISTHYDTFDNLACVVAGRRRFRLHPPEAIGDLYVGPIDRTLAGQPVSLAAGAADDERYPRFAAIRDQAQTAELSPGDALYLPKLWWHQVEGLDPVNVLVNYWWDAFRAGADTPYAAMMLAMIAVAERPPAERRAWKAFFDHYVFRPGGHPLAHLPVEDRGILGPLADGNYGQIRAYVMRSLRGG